MTHILNLLAQRLETPGVFNVQINRLTSGDYYVFSNAGITGTMLEGRGVTLELAIKDAFERDEIEDLLG